MTNTRDQIIQKTCELLELQGYHGTGLNQIIRESGSPKGSLYYHFPGGKEELASEAIKRVGEQVLERIRVNLAAIDHPAEAISAFIVNIALNVERSGYRAGGPITTIAMEMSGTNESLRQTCHHIYGEWRNAFAEKLMQSGISQERAYSVASLIVSAIEGGVILCRTERTPQPLELIAQEVARLVNQAV